MTNEEKLEAAATAIDDEAKGQPLESDQHYRLKSIASQGHALGRGFAGAVMAEDAQHLTTSLLTLVCSMRRWGVTGVDYARLQGACSYFHEVAWDLLCREQ